MDQQIARQIKTAIAAAKHILLISHEKPDGDTLGASLALADYLQQNNKKFKHFCFDPAPSHFDYLLNFENIIQDPTNIFWPEHDLVITIDCGDIKRTRVEENLNYNRNNFTLLNIDHHQSNNLFGQINLVLPLASSTCEIMYQLFKLLEIKINKNMANCLLTGILTDTMNFINPNTQNQTMQITSELVAAGAKFSPIIRSLTQNKNIAVLNFWGEILNRLQYNHTYNLAYTVIKAEDAETFGILPDEAREGLANFLNLLEDIDIIMVLTQEKNNVIKGSLRTTRDHIDVSEIAKNLGGGGHKKAAGFKIDGQLLQTATG